MPCIQMMEERMIISMKRRILSTLICFCIVFSLMPTVAFAAVRNSTDAVAGMSWGVNLVDLYLAETPETQDLRSSHSSTGYVDYSAAEFYDMCVALWFWDGSFYWISEYPSQKQDTIQVSIPIPNYDADIAEMNRYWPFFQIRCGDKSGGNDYQITMSNCQIVSANGTVLNNIGNLTAYGTTSADPDMNGWHWGFGSNENNWTEEITFFLGEWDPESGLLSHGADPKYNGARLTATLTINNASQLASKSKAEYYYCLGRVESDYKTLIDTYMAQGVNVFRLPVTWTWFTQNDGDFTIDSEWLAAIKETVDYILSKGAYCILNTHDDYLMYSYVAESDGNGGYTNFHWEDQWMEDRYSEYVNRRFEAIWAQIAAYFADYPDHLIFEPCNEPAMQWYSGVSYSSWMAKQEARVNELNNIFVETVRNSGGENETRILCLSVAEYNIHTHLSAIDLPEDTDYLMIQVHSYNELENPTDAPSWEEATDTLFADIAAFQESHPNVPVIIGEVGISHSYENLTNPEGAANKVSYFFGEAQEQGVPCLWWEDCYWVPESGSSSIYWIYDKTNDTWRYDILEAIQANTNHVHRIENGICIHCGQAFTTDGLNVLTLPQDTSIIEESAFISTSAEAIVVPEGCSGIGSHAFALCPYLKYVFIPESLTDIAADALEGSPAQFIYVK